MATEIELQHEIHRFHIYSGIFNVNIHFTCKEYYFRLEYMLLHIGERLTLIYYNIEHTKLIICLSLRYLFHSDIHYVSPSREKLLSLLELYQAYK